MSEMKLEEMLGINWHGDKNVRGRGTGKKCDITVRTRHEERRGRTRTVITFRNNILDKITKSGYIYVGTSNGTLFFKDGEGKGYHPKNGRNEKDGTKYMYVRKCDSEITDLVGDYNIEFNETFRIFHSVKAEE